MQFALFDQRDQQIEGPAAEGEREAVRAERARAEARRLVYD